jgi:predicted Zn-dependent peptidase
MLWHHVRGLAYKVHPYRWPTIGLVTEHIEGALLKDVEAFYYRFYHPNNAILCVTGALSLEETKALSEKWFGSITRKGERNRNRYPDEPVQTARRRLATEDLLPQDAVLMAFRTSAYDKLDWPVAGLLADICGGSETSPLHVELVKEQGIFASAEAFHMKGLSEGLWMVYGILNEGRTHEEGEAALRGLLDRCSTDIPSEDRLVRCRNMATTRLLFEETNPMNRAQKLCYYENIGLLEHSGKEAALLDAVNTSQLTQWASEFLSPEKSNVIYYSPRS